MSFDQLFGENIVKQKTNHGSQEFAGLVILVRICIPGNLNFILYRYRDFPLEFSKRGCWDFIQVFERVL